MFWQKTSERIARLEKRSAILQGQTTALIVCLTQAIDMLPKEKQEAIAGTLKLALATGFQGNPDWLQSQHLIDAYRNATSATFHDVVEAIERAQA